MTLESVPPQSARIISARADDGTVVAAELYEPRHADAVYDTVLFISGLGYGPWSWGPQLLRMRRDHRLVLMYNRGTGASRSAEGKEFSITDMANDVLAIIAKLGRRPVHVVGASMGGYIALETARASDRSVASVVTVASSSGGQSAPPVPEATAQLWRENAHLPPASFARATMRNSFAPKWCDRHTAQYQEFLEARLAFPVTSETWTRQSRACERFLRDGLTPGEVPQPVTAVHGTADRVVPYENLNVIKRRIPHARSVTIPRAGHLCWLERPDQLDEILREHLRRAQPPTIFNLGREGSKC